MAPEVLDESLSLNLGRVRDRFKNVLANMSRQIIRVFQDPLEEPMRFSFSTGRKRLMLERVPINWWNNFR